jgi:hypothetical protein
MLMPPLSGSVLSTTLPACLPPQVACGVGFTAFLVKADEPKVAAMGVYEPPEEPQAAETAASKAAAAKGKAAGGAKRKAAAAPAAGKTKKAK